MDDLITKQAAIEAIKSLPITLDAETVQRCIEAVSNMPPAERKKGEWQTKIVKQFCAPDCWYPGIFAIEGSWNEEEGSWLEKQGGFCSECGKQDEHYNSHNYCPLCGIRMRGDENATG